MKGRRHGVKYVDDTIEGSLYKQIKPHLVGEHAFPLIEFVWRSAHVTNCGSSGIMCQLQDLSCATHVTPRPSLKTRLLEDSIVNIQITNSVLCYSSKGLLYNKQIKPPFVGEHAFQLQGLFTSQITLQLGITLVGKLES